MITGNVRSWHSPHNHACQHNDNIALDCNCRMRRKPYRVIRVRAEDVNHGVNPRIIVEVHPNGGILKFREARRPARTALSTTVAAIYSRLTREKALKVLQARHAAKRERSKTRKLAFKLRKQAEREAAKS